MEEERSIFPIAHIHTDFKEKFGIPRQSGRVETLGRIVFCPAFRQKEALRGIEAFSHLWLLFDFSEAHREGFCPTVRPPRLGGNRRVGVFATRSPFRPNPIGLSSVRLEGIEARERLGPVLLISGVDMVDNTPVYDIKPYLPAIDAHPEALGGFAAAAAGHALRVEFPERLLSQIPENSRAALLALLAQDPRPSYQELPQRRYGVPFAGFDVGFTVDGDVLSVLDVTPYKGAPPYDS